MIEYLRRYLADAEEPILFPPPALDIIFEMNELGNYLRRYLADPI
jgi:hypothetical protein